MEKASFKILLMVATNLNSKGKEMSTSNSKINNFPRVLHVRLSSTDYEHVKTQAGIVGVPMSRFTREILTGVKIMAAVDAEALKELRRQGGICVEAIRAGMDKDLCNSAIKHLMSCGSALVRKGNELSCKPI